MKTTALLALSLLLAAGSARAEDRGPVPVISAAAPPSAMDQAPHLPDGPLQLFGQTPGEIHFMALSDLTNRDGIVEATVLTIAEPAQPRAGKSASLIVSRQAIWCGQRRSATYYAWYAADGVLLDAARAFDPVPLKAGSVSALLAARVCDKAPAGETVDGRAAAVALAHAKLSAP
ncbi:MAG: hypothetical protein JWP35_4384 [Caulobacter sp.]|nr:hypothetical protein [Caulobacter sp.]